MGDPPVRVATCLAFQAAGLLHICLNTGMKTRLPLMRHEQLELYRCETNTFLREKESLGFPSLQDSKVVTSWLPKQ